MILFISFYLIIFYFVLFIYDSFNQVFLPCLLDSGCIVKNEKHLVLNHQEYFLIDGRHNGILTGALIFVLEENIRTWN